MTSRVTCGPWASSCTSCEYHPSPGTLSTTSDPPPTLVRGLSGSFFAQAALPLWSGDTPPSGGLKVSPCQEQMADLGGAQSPEGWSSGQGDYLGGCLSSQSGIRGGEWVHPAAALIPVPNDLHSLPAYVASRLSTPTRARPSPQG